MMVTLNLNLKTRRSKSQLEFVDAVDVSSVQYSKIGILRRAPTLAMKCDVMELYGIDAHSEHATTNKLRQSDIVKHFRRTISGFFMGKDVKQLCGMS
jgi:hypothetical protein